MSLVLPFVLLASAMQSSAPLEIVPNPDRGRESYNCSLFDNNEKKIGLSFRVNGGAKFSYRSGVRQKPASGTIEPMDDQSKLILSQPDQYITREMHFGDGEYSFGWDNGDSFKIGIYMVSRRLYASDRIQLTIHDGAMSKFAATGFCDLNPQSSDKPGQGKTAQ